MNQIKQIMQAPNPVEAIISMIPDPQRKQAVRDFSRLNPTERADYLNKNPELKSQIEMAQRQFRKPN